MIELLKTFGKGVLYVIGLPFFIVALLFFAVFGLIAFVFQILISIFRFFTGRKFFSELDEDKRLKELKTRANERTIASPSYSTPQVNPEALEYRRDDEEISKKKVSFAAVKPQAVEKANFDNDDEEILGTYKPKTSSYSGQLKEDEKDNIGIDIDWRK